MKKKLLLVGCTSKISRSFIDQAYEKYDLYGACRNTGAAPEHLKKIYKVDLAVPENVKVFLKKLDKVTFDGVIFFASTYEPDTAESEYYLENLTETIRVNTLAAIQIVRGLQYNTGSSAILFGDAALATPKEGYLAYSLSKALLEQSTKQLAVELHKTTKVLCFCLGPVCPREDHPDKEAYYSRNLIRVDSPLQGLIHMLLFVIGEPDLCMTGTAFDYDGGAYLRRAK